MRQFRLSLLFFILSLAPLSISFAQQSEAPDFAITHEQLPEKLSALKGQVVYLDFWASWCKPCRKSFPWMNQMHQKYAGQGLQIIAINLDTEKALAKTFLEKVPAQMPIVYDPEGKIASDYQLIGMPSSYLIDKTGKIRFSHKGFFTRSEPLYEQELVLLLNE
ncbi:TlpA disulfide reductase family protein [Paraglaciecola arctica]|uniref:Thiol-disulfide oxidoreductase resA n=1 Tax=Paraglaciecola arctica BSs20135 TaxID=493475 RepID=K6YD83_9ALTE|nr:TlpA disulfide reductase family protein [Paraglaciecola arctica]GAC21886.1 thiol-disulfide oxidoreductase resA [Paraglaciecola arctica BSs20135]